MKLTTFYSNPMCSPTRAALLTGRDPIRSGAYNGGDPSQGSVVPVFYPPSYGMLPSSEILLSDLLKQQGYLNGIMGKWHLGTINQTALPLQRGFDRFWGMPYSTDMGCPPAVDFPCLPTAGPSTEWTPVPLYRGNDIIEQPTTFPDFMPRLTSESISFIEEAKQLNLPFFLYVAYLTPHVPLFTAPEFYNVSSRGLYGDVVEEIDHSVGVIVNKLKELHIDHNTLVIFTSDNGPSISFRQAGGSAGLFRSGKGTTWEGGVRVPSIWYWPSRITKSSINQSITSITDIFTTLIELAGGKIPSDRVIDGLNLSPVLFDNENLDRDCIVYYTQSLLTAVRCGEYKLHYYTKAAMVSPALPANPPLLYNINHDPSELYPLNNTLYSSIIDELNNYLNNNYYPSLIKGPSQFELYNETIGAYQPCCTGESDNINVTSCYCPPDRNFNDNFNVLKQFEYSKSQLDEILQQIPADY